eukprot:4483444-Pyramimonas_sp.AAC.1
MHPLPSRTRFQGSPKWYSVWTDETLNMVLRRVAQAAHALRLQQRVLAAFNIIGSLGLDRYIFGAAAYD